MGGRGLRHLSAGRHLIRASTRNLLHIGVFVDKCFDVGRIEDVHLWPFWSSSDAMQAYLKANATAFIIGRTDWESEQLLQHLRTVGFHFKAFADGPGNVLTQCGSDIGRRRCWWRRAGTRGVSFSNGSLWRESR